MGGGDEGAEGAEVVMWFCGIGFVVDDDRSARDRSFATFIDFISSG